MAIVDTLNREEFARRMMIRSDVYFSRDAIEAIYEALNEYSEAADEPVEFDPIGINCDYAEYDTLAEVFEDYGRDNDTLEALQGDTWAVELSNGHILINKNF